MALAPKIKTKKNMNEQEKKSSVIKRQRWTIGSIVEVKVEDYYVYAQITEKKDLAFFDYQATEPLISFEILESTPILFIVSVYSDVITKGVWLKVGKMPLRTECQGTTVEFIFDTINYKFELYIRNKDSFKTIPCEKKDILGLECCAVWEALAIEDRIACHYKGEISIWMENEYDIFGHKWCKENGINYDPAKRKSVRPAYLEGYLKTHPFYDEQ